MPTHQFDTRAESKTQLTPARQAPVVETATPVQASPAQPARTVSAKTAPSAKTVPVPAVAAQLAWASGGHLARAGNALLQLQRLHGNGYVQQVVGHARQAAQRWAAPVIQTKLVLGPAGDRYEREADRVSREVAQGSAQGRSTDADEIVRLSLRSGSHRCATSGASEPIPAEDQRAIQHALGRGQPLANRVREPMEQAFGADFRSVRIHTDIESDRLGQSLRASAFTAGRDIFLRRGSPDLESRAGQALLAHELTHVVQQSDGNRAVAAALGGSRVQRSCGRGGPGHEPGAPPGSGRPHHYKVETRVPHKPPEQVIQEMTKDASKVAPYARGEVRDGEKYTLPGLGGIRIDKTETGFVNVTQPDHVLHPGHVKTTVKPDGEGGSIVTREGGGTGLFGRTNTLFSSFLWGSRMDSKLKEKEKTT